MYVHLDKKEARGPDLLINCPACGAAGVPGLSYELKERAWFISVHRTAWVVCSACGRRLLSRASMEKIPAARYNRKLNDRCFSVLLRMLPRRSASGP